ncbi:hypothetical protein BDR26DRAFT_868741 [Obelidium mucronatum]|nr:hypothetical protein BDR26DRAFT_868741 [Obelidium mucronatum]
MENFYWTCAVMIPLFCIGVLMNGCLLFVILSRQKELLANRINYIYTSLVVICFAWSCVSLVKYGAGKSSQLWSSLDSSIMITLLIGVISSLSIVYLAAAAGFTLIILILLIYSLCAAKATTDAYPVFPSTEFTIWLSTTSFGAVCGFGSIIYLYTSTYFLIKQKLETSFADYNAGDLNLILSRKILKNSIVMTVAVLGCHLPNSIVIPLAGAQVVSDWVPTSIGYLFSALDNLITPFLVVYFSQPVRDVIMDLIWRPKEKENVDDVYDWERDTQSI